MASPETQGQLVGAGKSPNGREKKFGRRKVKNEEKSSSPLLLLVLDFSSPVLFFVLDFSSPEFFSRPFRLFPASTNCPWVSEHMCPDKYSLPYCELFRAWKLVNRFGLAYTKYFLEYQRFGVKEIKEEFLLTHCVRG